MSNYAPGWYPDTSGRYAQRYYDGSAWTEHVVDASGNRATDPVGGPPPAPAPSATPSSAGTTVYGGPPTSPPGGFAQPPAYGQAPVPAPPSAPSSYAPPTYGQPPSPPVQPFQPDQRYGQPAPGRPASAPAAAGGLTVGLLVVVVGVILALLSLFVLAYWSIGGDGATLGDIADADRVDLNGLASGYADVGRYLGLLALIFALLAVVRLAGFGAMGQQLPLIAAIAVGVFGLWHFIGLFVGPDDLDAGPAFGGFVGVVGYAAAAGGQFLRTPLGTTSRR